MDGLANSVYKIGVYIVGIVLLWLGLVGLLEVGFTTISELPLIDSSYVPNIIFAFQIILGLGIFNRSVRRLAIPVAMLYFAFLLYAVYLNFPQVFYPAWPYLSDIGRNTLLEFALLFSGFAYLKKSY